MDRVSASQNLQVKITKKKINKCQKEEVVQHRTLKINRKKSISQTGEREKAAEDFENPDFLLAVLTYL